MLNCKLKIYSTVQTNPNAITCMHPQCCNVIVDCISIDDFKFKFKVYLSNLNYIQYIRSECGVPIYFFFFYVDENCM